MICLSAPDAAAKPPCTELYPDPASKGEELKQFKSMSIFWQGGKAEVLALIAGGNPRHGKNASFSIFPFNYLGFSVWKHLLYSLLKTRLLSCTIRSGCRAPPRPWLEVNVCNLHFSVWSGADQNCWVKPRFNKRVKQSTI